MDYSHILHRFPQFELSYETFAHKKVPPIYDVCLSIPAGKKQLIWFTFDNTEDIAILIDLNKSRQICKMTRVNVPSLRVDTYFGTLLYGTIVQEPDSNQIFIVEDIYHYEGTDMKRMLFGEKLTFLQYFFTKNVPSQHKVVSKDQLLVALPYMRVVNDTALDSLPFYESITKSAKYMSHHIQFRSTSSIVPYLNHIYKKPQPIVEQVPSMEMLVPRTDCDYRLPVYSHQAIFRAMADIRDDVYHLFAYGKEKPDVYVGVAYIGTRTQSKTMNSLFRKIRENINIDYGEESDDEECFQDTRVDKYVDLAREHKIECVFNRKFRMWEPVKQVAMGKYTHITELISNQQNANANANRIYHRQSDNSRPNYNSNRNHDSRPNQRPKYHNNNNNK
jgi:hypothetical protein